MLAQRARWSLEAESAPVKRETAPFGLSAREVEVLQLLAAGRTNRQIAEELFITEKTAGHHVSSILGKLGAATRVEAASIAFRMGLAGNGQPA